MILVIGGLNGFVGSNTTRALVEQGLDCVVTRHKDTQFPSFLQKYIDDHRVSVESADATSIADLRKIGEKHKVDGIVNVAGGFKSADKSPVPGVQGYFDMLDATFRMAEGWKVKRLLFSSTGGIYFGLPGPVNEDTPVPLSSPFPIIAYQKIVEVAVSEFAKKSGISSVCVRLMGMFGPWWDPAQKFLPATLVHAAVKRQPANLEDVFGGAADDAYDFCYIKDAARAIALLQTREKLQYDVYNIGSGMITPNKELAEAVKRVVPAFKVDLPLGHSPFPPLPLMETKRLQEDTGFSPAYDVRAAVQDYVEWLKAGNPK